MGEASTENEELILSKDTLVATSVILRSLECIHEGEVYLFTLGNEMDSICNKGMFYS